MQGTVRGILGNFDGEAGNDMFNAAGEQIGRPVSFETLYRNYGDSWRITQEESLFDYEEGKNTATYQLFDFPTRRVRLEDLDEAERDRAEAICKDAGVTGDAQLNDCIFDVALTGDAVFAENNERAKTPLEKIVELVREDDADTKPEAEVEDEAASDVVIDFADELYAGFDLDLDLEGAVEGDFVTIVAPDAPDEELDRLRVRIRGEEYKLQLPTAPGQYEIRYVADERPRRLVARRAVEVKPLEVMLEGPEQVSGGDDFQVVVRGKYNPDDFLTVVAIESPSDYLDARARNRVKTGTLGAGLKRTVRLTAPEAPGRYEVRYITHRTPHRAFAEIPLQIE
jgi:hypothetical protein